MLGIYFAASKMKVLSTLTVTVLLFSGIHTMILFPEDIPTALNLMYSRLPPVKAGKDTRVGVGFRMGPNMDAQVIVEVGPQANTEPLVAPSSADVSRRQTENRNDITDNGIMTTASWTMHKLKNALKQWFSTMQKEFAKSYNNTEAGDVDDTRTFLHKSP